MQPRRSGAKRSSRQRGKTSRKTSAKRPVLRQESLERREMLAADVGCEVPHPHPLWAPDTPAAVVQEFEQTAHRHGDGACQCAQCCPSVQQLGEGAEDWQIAEFNFSDNDRWDRSASDGTGLRQGDSTTLTWSIVPDGTSVAGFNGEPTSDSDLIAFLDGIYGAGSGGSDLTQRPWFSIVASSFDRWEELSGIDFVYSPQDDGAAMRTTSLPSGVLGVRGDIRISGHPIDGGSGTLAYNFFPEYGDMVIDTSDTYFNNTRNNSRGLRNTIAHELGHGLGLNHVEPVNRTKLMEPFLTQNYDGPQYDDILAIHRGYGDVWEQDGGNDTIGTATDLGSLALGGVITIGGDATDSLVSASDVEFVSIDDDSDVDFFRFDKFSLGELTLTLDPLGPTYTSDTGTLVGSAQSDLALELWAAGGNAPLVSVDQAGLGVGESITLELSTAGTYYVGVRGANSRAQFYQLDLNLVDLTPQDVTGPSVVSAEALGSVAGEIDRVVVQFDEAIDEATLSPADASLTGPAGAIAIASVLPLGGNQYEIRFAPQTAAGDYRFELGPNVRDLANNLMDQDGDGTPGEALDDRFGLDFAIADSTPTLNLSDYTLLSYGGSAQDVTGNAAIQDAGATLYLSGNRWKAIELPTTITADTVLEFDFRSSSQGEIHSIGFDNDLDIGFGGPQSFKLHGTQNWGITAFDNYVPSDWQHYEIPVGQFLTGDFRYLTFGMDHDVANPTGESYFANIQIRDAAPITNTSGLVDFNNYNIDPYGGPDQNDGSTTVAVLDGGATLQLSGNVWRKINLPYNVTADTVLEFDFRSSSEGEIHSIGFDKDLSIDFGGPRTFKVHGTQSWGITAFDNYVPSGWQRYTIPVGQFLTGNFQYLTFGMDHDVANPTGESFFSNVRIYEAGASSLRVDSARVAKQPAVMRSPGASDRFATADDGLTEWADQQTAGEYPAADQLLSRFTDEGWARWRDAAHEAAGKAEDDCTSDAIDAALAADLDLPWRGLRGRHARG